MTPSRGRVGLALRVGVSLLLVTLLFVYVVDARQVWRVLREFRPGYFALAILVFTVDRVLMAYKWTLLLRARGHRLPLRAGTTVYCAAMLWGSALPATVGADAIRALLVMRRGISGTDALVSILVERLVGYLAALVLGIASLVVLRSAGVLGATLDPALYVATAVLLGSLGLVALSFRAGAAAWTVAFLPRRARESALMRRLGGMAAAYRSLGAARGTVAWFAVLTLVEQLVGIGFTWTLARGLDVPVNPVLLLGVMPLALLVSRLPISLDGLGVFEAVFVGLLLLAGISADASLAIAISGRAIQLLALVPWWLAEALQSGVRPPLAPSTGAAGQSPSR